MPAPKGNEFWKIRSKHGRHMIFADSKIMLAAAYEYFEWNERNPWYKNEALKGGDNAGKIIQVPTERPMTIEGLTQFWGVHTKYLEKFERELDDKDPSVKEDFSPVITFIKEVIRRQKIEGVTVGVFKHNIIAAEIGIMGDGDDSKKVTFNIEIK